MQVTGGCNSLLVGWMVVGWLGCAAWWAKMVGRLINGWLVGWDARLALLAGNHKTACLQAF
jgi:hypothetical protein